ncbi:MAG: hypothetical protein CVV64_12120 [Candidatus Wallbacteria bacterium HGW-Wallbacteria-1]|jgi:NADPH-dependent 2,4-dienoyl-CoA reductase/sulfur reductase-like enzyme|uniref:FAD/NAD(P)-binding domain-containing protein n=1 Tax=Candidatus Wallbacteria bacterium HGW-Wallbacteria-1 TaxID=2013854 RepID=A0A2N1PNI9_9BACT|nr:MAG: hypothetical protein CVV64_12120 [Candidatus Wallbacteria bacterium HGW-Wallbacteria-1]
MNFNRTRRVIIAGCQGGGINAAREARRTDSDAEIILFDSSPFPPYSACSIPHVVSGKMDVAELITTSGDQLLAGFGIKLVSNATVVTGDAENRWVEIATPAASEIMEWDSLVIATGASPGIPAEYAQLFQPSAHWNQLCPNVHLLRNPSDADFLAQAMAALPAASPVAVIGAGSIGISMVEAALARGLCPYIVEAGPSIMGFSDGPAFDMITSALTARGVDIYLNQPGSAPIQEKGCVTSIQMPSGQVPCSLLILSCGVQPRTALAAEMGLRLGSSGAISVRETMETSASRIFAAGDCCETLDQLTGGRIYFPQASVAVRQGRIAGRNAVLAARPGGTPVSRDSLNTYPGTLRIWVTDCLGLEIASAGITTESTRDHVPAAGRDGVRSVKVMTRSRTPHFSPREDMAVELFYSSSTKLLMGGRIIGPAGTAADRINFIALACQKRMSLPELANLEMAYSPRIAPLWDPIITAARTVNQ